MKSYSLIFCHLLVSIVLGNLVRSRKEPESRSTLDLFLLPSTNFSSSFLALDSAPQTNFLVQDELPDNTNPATVVRQILVEFLGNLVDLPESGPRNGREIVMLVVQTDVVGQVVERSVV